MSSDGNSGVFMMLGGLTVLVMTGVGFSLLVDRRFQSSRQNGTEQQVMAADAEHLAGLVEYRDRKQGELDRIEGPRLSDQRELDRVKERMAANAKKLGALKEAAAATRTANEALEADYAGYRSAYRTKAWEAASGQQFPFIALRNGRRYEKVTITRVTPAGLEITHTEGRARIDAADLDASWQDRFQWNDAERQAILDKERRDMGSLAPVVTTPPPKPQDATGSDPVADPHLVEKIQKLRIELMGWNQQVSTLSSQHSEAVGKSYNRENPSVPGSLETWAARATRLAGELSKARSGQSQSRSRLQLLAPEDPLVQPQYR